MLWYRISGGGCIFYSSVVFFMWIDVFGYFFVFLGLIILVEWRISFVMLSVLLYVCNFLSLVFFVLHSLNLFFIIWFEILLIFLTFLFY